MIGAFFFRSALRNGSLLGSGEDGCRLSQGFDLISQRFLSHLEIRHEEVALLVQCHLCLGFYKGNLQETMGF